MFKFIKRRKAEKKCYQVLASCQNFGQLNTTMNMIYYYGKMYNYPMSWMRLDRKAFSMWKEFVDRADYEERLKSINEQETSDNAEGQSV